MSTKDALSTDSTSREEKFFGVSSTYTKSGKDDPELDIIVEDDDDESPQPKKAVKKSTYQPPVEPDEDEELATYSETVQKRIKKMRWKQGEVERERDALKAERDEAFRVAQTLHGQNQQYVNTIQSGEGRLVAEMKQRAANDVALAKAAYAQAYEKGDTAKIIEAQELMLNANADLRTAVNYETDYKSRNSQHQPVQQQQQQQYRPQAPVQRQVPSVPAPTSAARQWAEDNPWFGDQQHPDMTALAYGVHENLIKHQGIKPDTDEYFEAIDNTMRQRFPEYFTEDQGGGKPVPTQRSAPATVVGSGQRQSANKPRKVVLKPSQVRLAKRLGITVEQYANQMIKGN